MNNNIIFGIGAAIGGFFGIGAAIGGFVLGVITDRMTTKYAIDEVAKTVEETTENIVKAQGAVEIGQKVIENQGHIIDLLNNTIKEQDKKYKEMIKNYRTLEKVNELAEETDDNDDNIEESKKLQSEFDQVFGLENLYK